MSAIDTGDGFKKYKTKEHFKPSELKHTDFGAPDGKMGGNKTPGNYDSGKHPGFKAVQAEIASKGGYSKERAGAILAAKTRGASKAAKAANPRLKKVKG